jgi:hypothetical protein
MSTKTRKERLMTEEEIDAIVVAQAEDESAWEEPVHVEVKPASLSLPPALAARAAFLARLHRQKDIENWLRHIIEERVEIEEAAFASAKRQLTAKEGA